jgi:hypothetical protein
VGFTPPVLHVSLHHLSLGRHDPGRYVLALMSSKSIGAQHQPSITTFRLLPPSLHCSHHMLYESRRQLLRFMRRLNFYNAMLEPSNRGLRPLAMPQPSVAGHIPASQDLTQTVQ